MTKYINPSTRNGGVEQIMVPERGGIDSVEDAPFDDTQNVRVNGEWAAVGGDLRPRFRRQDSAGVTTDASGFATFAHGCAFTPTAVFVTMRNPTGSFAVFWGAEGFTATNVTMRWMSALGGSFVSANTLAWTAVYWE